MKPSRKRFRLFAANRAVRAALTAVALAAAAPHGYGNTVRAPERAALAKANAKSARPAVRPPVAASALPSRLNVPVVTANGTAADQAGYVHYFVITGPDGVSINHVGIELPGDRIVSSFPDDGVSVAPFVKRGAMTTSAGNVYEVEHLYGVRPFADDASMRALQRELDSRVQPWIDAKTPYCDELTPSRTLCVSCLSFAMSVLYPERMPADFKGADKSMYTTDDLLMYLAGVPIDATREVRAARIAALAVPAAMREELVRISAEVELARAAPASAPASASPQRPATVDLPKRVLIRRRS